MRYIPLEVPLTLLDISRLHEGDDFGRARIERLHKSLDIASLPCCITSFEYDKDFLSTLDDILLEFHEFELECEHLSFIADIRLTDSDEAMGFFLVLWELFLCFHFLLIFLYDIDEDEVFRSFLVKCRYKTVDIVDDIDETAILFFTFFSYSVTLSLSDGLELVSEDFEIIYIAIFFELFIGVTGLIEKCIKRLPIECEEIIEYIGKEIGSHESMKNRYYSLVYRSPSLSQKENKKTLEK